MTRPTPDGIHLQGHKVLITGAARGLGASFARALHAAGAQVAISDLLHAQGQALAQALGEGAFYVPLDLEQPESIQEAVHQAAQRMGGLDGLVNNGAVTSSGGKTLDELDIDMWDKVMRVNVRGTWLTARAARPHLAASGRGRIVNLASDTALWGAPKLLAYVASKAAVVGMTRSLARELGPEAITVNAIAPGLTLVEATAYVPAQRHAHYLQGRALQRAQVPEDIDAAVLFLLSQASGFITGQLLPVNGGFVMN